MQVSAINPSFQGRRDRIDELINLDDQSIQRIAYARTMAHRNEAKEKKFTKSLILNTPIVAGISAAVLAGNKSKIFSKEVTGASARLANGLKNGGYWAAGLGVIGLVGLAKSLLSKNSESVRKFDKEHPFLSIGALLTAGLGAIALTNRGLAKIATKEAPKFLQKGTERVAQSINNSKITKNISSGLRKLSSKTPDALKDIGATILYYAPEVLLLSTLFRSFGHDRAVSKEFSKNYYELKEKQINLAQKRNIELQLENDFFKTDAKNREDLKLVKNPLEGIPQEVIENSDLG